MSKAKVREKEPGSGRVKSRPIEEEQKPWGSFHTLEEGPGYKVKRLVVLPGQRLSLQKHRRRAEHWVVVSGTATVVNGTRVLTLPRRACTVIQRQAWHRIENHGRQPVVMIEVQHGTYLGEDDIIRKQDDYGRAEPKKRAASRVPRPRAGWPRAGCPRDSAGGRAPRTAWTGGGGR